MAPPRPGAPAARTLVLGGFMATGKTSVGARAAARLGRPFVDTDDLVAARAGMPIGPAFATLGEAAFRAIEREVVGGLLDDGVPRVIALGGGALTNLALRRRVLDEACLVTLTASAAAIAERAGPDVARERPNLAPGHAHGTAVPAALVEARARELLGARADVYAETHATLATDGRHPDELAALAVRALERDVVAVPLGLRSYVVEIVNGDPAPLGALLRGLAPTRLVVVTDENVHAACMTSILRSLDGAAPRVEVVLRPGEPEKTLAAVERIWDAALDARADRRAVVLAVGGGVVGDLAGFAASTLLRGVRVVQAPTSLLAMVDSSVGGKTGFDTAHGKNLVGSFLQPSGVVVDLAHLATLPPRELRAGLAEVAKMALLVGGEALARLEADAERLAAGDRAALRDAVRFAVAEKARVVRDDEHETGDRALLNLGHTFGHALERHGDYATWLHGEAVALGLAHEHRAGERLGLVAPGTAARTAALLTRLGLPTEVDRATTAAAVAHLALDKKRAGARVRVPLVRRPGEPFLESLALDALGDALIATA